MYSSYTLVILLTLLCLQPAALVNAALFILEPSKGSTCQGGQSCAITWIDNGEKPLLSAIGVSTVGLYTGNQQLVQSISPVDVASTHSINFTPTPGAGPNSDAYYIAISSTKSAGNDSTGYSPFFSLTGMSGSFDSPLPAATSSIPIPASLANPSTSSIMHTHTATVGTLSTASPAPTSSSLPVSAATAKSSTVSSISRLTTSTIPASISKSISTSATSTRASTPSAASGSTNRLPDSLPVLFLAIFSSIFFA